jgi:hypothetical protein
MPLLLLLPRRGQGGGQKRWWGDRWHHRQRHRCSRHPSRRHCHCRWTMTKKMMMAQSLRLSPEQQPSTRPRDTTWRVSRPSGQARARETQRGGSAGRAGGASEGFLLNGAVPPHTHTLTHTTTTFVIHKWVQKDHTDACWTTRINRGRWQPV